MHALKAVLNRGDAALEAMDSYYLSSIELPSWDYQLSL